MEESAKRQERLRSMRLEAEQAILSSDARNSPGASLGLTNPLNEAPASQSTRNNSRFDYYTDPLAAFSKRGKVRNQVQQDCYTPPRPRIDTTATPSYPANAFSPEQSVFQAPGIHHSSPLLRSSTQTSHPFAMPRVNSPGVFCGPNTYSPCQETSQAPEVYHSSPLGSPIHIARPFGTPHFNSSRGATFPRFSQRGSPIFNYGQGRGQRFNNSSSPGSGRGGSHYHSGRSRGRSGSHDITSADLRPDRFYIKSMIEDPWKRLNPVVWRRRDVFVQNRDPVSQNSWIPTSTSMTNARPSEDSKKSVSESNLAEYLAASFNEAVDNEASPYTRDGL